MLLDFFLSDHLSINTDFGIILPNVIVLVNPIFGESVVIPDGILGGRSTAP
jgi:hypothetical protein